MSIQTDKFAEPVPERLIAAGKEPYLIQQGYLQRTPRGRVATASIWRHFGLESPSGVDPQLF